MDDENDYLSLTLVLLLGGDGMLDIDPGFVDIRGGRIITPASSFLISAGHPDSTDVDGSRSDLGAHPYETDNTGTVW